MSDFHGSRIPGFDPLQPGGTSPKVALAGRTPLSKGTFRACYRHPGDPAKCIKIALTKPSSHHVGKVDRLLGRVAPDPNRREFDEYRRLVDRGVPLREYFPEVHGYVETDLGQGLVVDFMYGVDAEPPVSIASYVRGLNRPAGLSAAIILDGLRKFAEFCSRHGILGACTEANNIGFIRTSTGFRCVAYDLKLRLNKELFPISTFLPAARRRKVARRFARTIAEVERDLVLPRRMGLLPIGESE